MCLIHGDPTTSPPLRSSTTPANSTHITLPSNVSDRGDNYTRHSAMSSVNYQGASVLLLAGFLPLVRTSAVLCSTGVEICSLHVDDC